VIYGADRLFLGGGTQSLTATYADALISDHTRSPKVST
jgi:hypothetical protein